MSFTVVPLRYRAAVPLAALLLALCSGAAAQRNLTVSPTAAQVNEQRIALVIGNSAYSKSDALPQLKNPSNDARDIAAALKANGFSSVSLVLDADFRRMREAITRFGGDLKKAGSNAVGLFYYAGHGVQDSGHNYLIPVGTRIAAPKDLEFDTVDAQRVLAYMEDAGNAVNIVILDACRDNPFPVLNKFRSAAAPSAGLAQMRAPAGSFIAFAAAEGQKASDGDGRNGLFTQQFLESLRNPDSEIDAVFRRVTAGVAEKTLRQQVPWRNSSLTNTFYFRPPAGGAAASVAPAVQAAPVDSSADDRTWWNSLDQKNPDELKAYLERFPNGLFAPLAQTRLKGLQSTQVATVAPAIAATRPEATAVKPAPGLSAQLTPETLRILSSVDFLDDLEPYLKRNSLQDLRRQADAGDVLAQARWCAAATHERYNTGLRPEEGIAYCRHLAEQGILLGMNLYARAYFYGRGVETNDGEALRWTKAAADKGDALGQVMLAAMYARGRGVQLNYSEAMRLYRAAADKGSAVGMLGVGVLYANGSGVSQDYAEARKWFQAAANKGYQPAKDALQQLNKLR